MTTYQSASSAFDSLGEREQQVLVMIAKGMTMQQIAKQICRSPDTVNVYRDRAYKALGINKAAQAGVICALAGAVTDWRAQ